MISLISALTALASMVGVIIFSTIYNNPKIVKALLSSGLMMLIISFVLKIAEHG